jgi:CTP:molybdopterin cytidylyltransferase MocA
VDQPFIDKKLLNVLARQVSRESYAAPVFEEKGGHPVLLGPEILPSILDCTDEHSTLMDILNLFPKKKVVTKDMHVCVNINTAAEYKKYFSRLPETV